MADITNNWHIKDLGPEETIPYDLLLQADPSKTRVDKYVRNNLCRVLTQPGSANVVGVYVLQINLGPRVDELSCEAEILNIAVSSEFQGSGLGKFLIKDVIAAAKRRNIHFLHVGTGNSSVSQLAFYQKCGFRIVGIDFDYFPEHYDEKIIENGIWCRDLIKMTLNI